MEFPADFYTVQQNMSYQQPSAPFPQNVSAFFRRPNRIVKPTSRRNSPRALTRRRTTAAAHYPSRNPNTNFEQPVEPYQWQYAPGLLPQRPISWHAPLFDHPVDSSGQLYQFQSPNTEFLGPPFHAGDFEGLITPVSMPLANEPQIQELITPLEELSAHDYEQQSSDWQNSYAKQTSMFNMDNSQIYYPTFVPQQYQPQRNPNWYCDLRPQDFGVETGETEASPLILPIKNCDDSKKSLSAPKVDDEQDELVGMGLYDSPSEVQSSFSSGTPRHMSAGGTSTGKGLKLEESFVPGPIAAEDVDEEEQNAGEANEPGANAVPSQTLYPYSNDVPYVSQQTFPPSTNYSFFFEQDPQDLDSVSGGLDSGCTNYDATNYGCSALNMGSQVWF